MGAKFTICCCHYYLSHSREEKNAILRLRNSKAARQPEVLSSDSSDTDEESLFGPHPPRRNPWNEQPSQRSTVEPWATKNKYPDKELQAFINMRDQTDQATEEWEKLNYDIYTIRYARREVRSRWKKILLQLGYQCEADALLCVNRQSRFSPDQEHLNKAKELLGQLLDHTSLFPPKTGHQKRYLYVMDRLVSLDSAEDFVRLAKVKYPKKVG
ncbi:melanoregulin-like [Notolabrus celidotus]|uniref:melanoregulin-like n=1 Tax=Notolabrus celidotus TaxID=1203425 RepID=UPI00148FBE1B|nr:melanoregulin-like [Notolabrus celidotus]XP_034549796.1 melanoregulin-like [Notolabrus celidotus]XP_034549797.1 melanoregulin-like [Notolabrus celidotus]XP_034549798.1 melanoregulin-like [Notolabrus celidotus]XP_034549799.1 melanoregulin-like [Notolabrus celidotus]